MRPIDDENLAQAALLLKKGFAERSHAFWDTSLRQLRIYAEAREAGPIGQLMMVGDTPAGVILTIGSRLADGTRVVNLSSWYVEQKYRWLAPRMLQSVVADGAAVYTDLSPSAETIRINEALGFRAVTGKLAVLFLPCTALLGGGAGAVVALADLPEGALTPDELSMLAEHRALGCLCAAIHAGGRYHPVVFNITRRKGVLPVAELVYVARSSLLGEAGAAVARFLLRSGALFLTFPSERRLPTGIVKKRYAPFQVKGAWDADRFEQAFSELAFLRN